MNDALLNRLGMSSEVFTRMVVLRRDLHRHPELSQEEGQTARRLISQLEALGLAFTCNVAGHGIVAEIPGRVQGPRIALRADMDALPITEETGLEFSSVHDGVMHACGHDGHASILIGAAELLLRGEPPPLPVRLIWQPAEEQATGARAMIEAGVLDGVGLIFGGHIDRHHPPGELIVTEGPVNGSTDTFEIDIHGQQGHGARPHETVDAVVVGSLLVTAIQTIVSREVDPAHPSVVTIGSFHAGTAPNVISGAARLEGTIRAQHPEVRHQLSRAIARVSEAIAHLHGAKVDIDIKHGTPPVINTPEMTALAREAAVAVVGPDRVKPLRTANMGGEDFAYYLQKVPGGYIRFGAQVPGREGFPAHSSRFDFDEQGLATGAAWFAKIAHLGGTYLTDRL